MDCKSIEILELIRWDSKPECPRCKSLSVRQVKNKIGERNHRFLWRCYGCKKQFTVRIGTEFENCKIPMDKLIQAVFSCKNAFQAHKKLNISYKSALFLFDRIRDPEIIVSLNQLRKKGIIKKANYRSWIKL